MSYAPVRPSGRHAARTGFVASVALFILALVVRGVDSLRRSPRTSVADHGRQFARGSLGVFGSMLGVLAAMVRRLVAFIGATACAVTIILMPVAVLAACYEFILARHSAGGLVAVGLIVGVVALIMAADAMIARLMRRRSANPAWQLPDLET